MPHIRYRGQHSALIILHEQWYDSSTMFHPYLLGDVPRNPPSNKTASSLRSLLGRSILAGEMVHIVLRSLNLSKMICRFRNAHPFPFQTTTIRSCDQTVMFRSTGNPTSASGTIWGVPSHASKLQYRDANDQKNLRDQKESEDDSDDSNDSDSDDSDVNSMIDIRFLLMLPQGGS